MTRPILSATAAFAPATLDKVERLLEILDTFRGDPVLGPAFVLHGGTALNVFLDELPRLSVDIDVMYVGSEDANDMRRARLSPLPRADSSTAHSRERPPLSTSVVLRLLR